MRAGRDETARAAEETQRKIDTAREPTVSSMIVLIGRWRKNPIESANEVRFAIKTRAGPPRGRRGTEPRARAREYIYTHRHENDGNEAADEAAGAGGARERGTNGGVDGCRRPKGRNKCTHCAELVD